MENRPPHKKFDFDFDHATPEQLAEYSEYVRSRSRPGYVGVALLWVIDLLFVALGIVVAAIVATSTVEQGSWLPLIIVFVISAAAVLLIPLLVKWTLDVAPERAQWDQEYGRR